MVDRKIINVLSVAIIISFSSLSLIAITGGFSQFEFKGFPYKIPLGIYMNDLAISQHGYDHYGFLLLEHVPLIPEAEPFTLRLIGTSLSAQNPIKVIAEIDFNEKSITPEFKDKYYDNNETLFIVFPNAYQFNPLNPNEKQYHAFVPIYHQKDNFFKGEGYILYSFSGEYGYLFLTTEDMRSTLDVDGTWDLSAYDYRIQNQTIPIESASVTATINANNLFLVLTFVATAFGTINLLHYYSNKPVP